MRQTFRNWAMMAFAIFFCASCIEEEPDGNTAIPTDHPMIEVDIPDMTGETVGGSGTRMGGTPDENKIDRIAVIILRKSSEYNRNTDLEMVTADDDLIDMGSDGKSLKVYLANIRPETGDKVYLFCNPRFYSEEEISYSFNSDNINEYMHIDHPLTSNPDGYLIPMAGSFTWSDSGNSCSVIRSVAKVRLLFDEGVLDVRQEQEGGYYFANYIYRGTMLSGFYSASTFNNFQYDMDGGNAYKLSDANYIYEYPHSTKARTYTVQDDQFNKNRACIILVLDGKYYRLDFYNRTDKKYFDILRNHSYTFKITGINSEGYDTEKEALDNHSSNIEYQVDVEDEYYSWAKQVYSNGQYAICTDIDVDYVIPQVGTASTTSTVMHAGAMIFPPELGGSTSISPATNTVTVTGGGISSVESQIYLQKNVNKNKYRIQLTIDPAKFTNGGTLNLQLGNIRKSYAICKTIPVDAHYNTYEIKNVISAKILNEDQVPWLELSKEASSNSNLTYKKENMAREVKFDGPTSLYVHIGENTSQVDKNASDKKFRYGAVTIEVQDGDGKVEVLNYAFQQHALRYVGMYGGMQDRYPNSRGMAIEQMEEVTTGTSTTSYWGFDGKNMGYMLSSANIDKDEFLNLPIRQNGWKATKELAEKFEESGHGKDYAARYCYEKNRDLNGNGTLEPDEIKWYLPALDQIIAGGKALSLRIYYLSTTENSDNSIWTYYPNTFNRSYVSKANKYSIRCVRDM